jgi:glycosyltransferase involved in cell wall biosynthesis
MTCYKRLINRIRNKEVALNSGDFVKLLDTLTHIREKSEHVVLFGSPTENNWKGIANMTRLLFPKNALEIPQSFSNSKLSKKQTRILINEIDRLGFKKVTFSGFAPFLFDWIHNLNKKLKIECIYHGTISEFHSQEIRSFIKNLVSLYNSGKVHEIGFIHNDLIPFFDIIYNIPSRHYQPENRTRINEFQKINLDETKFHIGVFGSDTFNKNLHNQVIHALMIENSIVHVLDKSIFDYLNMKDRIIDHGSNISHDLFLNIIGSMDLNLYMSYNESFGLIKFESELLGVPCCDLHTIDYHAQILTFTPTKNNFNIS